MSDTKQVLISINFSPEVIPKFYEIVETFESHGYAVEIGPSYRAASPETLIHALQGKHAYLVGGEFITRNILAACPALKVASRMGVGYNDVDVAAATEHGVAVTVTAGANAPAVAEHTLAMLLASTRHVAELDRRVRKGVWGSVFGIGVSKKTLGIIGMGAVGKCLTQYISGFQMRVLAYDPYPDEAFAKEHGVEYCPLEKLVRESDFITLHCPYNADNHYLLAEKQFAMMKENVQIINCARGKLLDEGALYRALTEGKVAGAALDCYEQEPLNRDSPLLSLENVVFSSHTAGMTYEVRAEVIRTAFQNVIDVDAGIRPHGFLNPEVFNNS